MQQITQFIDDFITGLTCREFTAEKLLMTQFGVMILTALVLLVVH